MTFSTGEGEQEVKVMWKRVFKTEKYVIRDKTVKEGFVVKTNY